MEKKSKLGGLTKAELLLWVVGFTLLGVTTLYGIYDMVQAYPSAK